MWQWMKVSLSTFITRFKSTQILTCPDGFGTTTMPKHHGDSSPTGDMTPNDSIHLNSFCTFLRSDSGTFLAV